MQIASICGRESSMVCKSCCRNKRSVRKGRWSPEEDMKLRSHITRYGVVCWRLVPSLAGLDRCGKSCRLRWLNYLRPGLRTHHFSSTEIALILHMHSIVGNRWCEIAKLLPGRTDNHVKNFWNCYLKPRQQVLSSSHDHTPQQQDHLSSPPCLAESYGNDVTVEAPAAAAIESAQNAEGIHGLVESCQHHQQQQEVDFWADGTQWNCHWMNDNMPIPSSMWDCTDISIPLP